MTELVGGRHPVRELVENQPGSIERIYVLKSRSETDLGELVETVHERGLEVEYIERDRLDSLYGATEHRGIVAEISGFTVQSLEELIQLSISGNGRLLILDQVQDPVNLGTLARTGLYFGFDGIVKMTDRSAPLSDTVLETSAGAASRLPFAEVTNLSRALEELKENRFWIVGASARGDQSPEEVPRDRNLAIVLGHEGSGLRRLTREHCDFLVGLPGTGSLDSLNVGVAGSILCYLLRPLRGKTPD